MYTYQDFLAKSTTETGKMRFVKAAIDAHKATALYDNAVTAQMYDRHRNKTIMEYQKMLNTFSGSQVPDIYTANHKIASNFFNRFVVQETQYLLGNGVTWGNESTANKLGKDFDMRLQEIGKASLVDAVAFGFWNYDHMEVFRVTEFCPLYDEDNGAMMAGIRFWQISADKPLRATLYEVDGITDYRWNKDGTGEILREKRPYVQLRVGGTKDATAVYAGENYETFPIVPMWGNPHRQSELVGLRSEIDAYDLIQSGFANDLDDATEIYWIVENAGGMDDVDLARFLQHIKERKIAQTDEDGAKVTPHTMEVPYNAREAVLDRLERTMYKDAMALNTETIAGGASTATQIKASYEPLNNKTDQFEACVIDFIQSLLAVAGIEDSPTFTRSIMVNTTETIQVVLSSASYLPQEYVTEKIMTLLGDGDKVQEALDKMAEETVNRYTEEEDEEEEEA